MYPPGFASFVSPAPLWLPGVRDHPPRAGPALYRPFQTRGRTRQLFCRRINAPKVASVPALAARDHASRALVEIVGEANSLTLLGDDALDLPSNRWFLSSADGVER